MIKHIELRAILLVTATLTLVIAAEAGQRENVVLSLSNGSQLPLTVILPEGYSEDAPHPMVLALPPGAGNTSMVNAFLANYWIEEADRRGFILVGAAVVGSSLDTTGFGVVEAVFDWADANLNYDPARVTLAGQSNGGLGAFHVGRIAPERFASIIVMPGGFGEQGELEQLRGKPVLLLVGERDTDWVRLSQRTRDFLVLAGAEPQLELVPGGGHVFPYSGRVLFDWIELQYAEQRN